jgi:adenylate cyclase
MIEVSYERLGSRQVATPGITLLEVSQAEGVPHFHACGGHARCSTCRVLVLSGGENLAPRTPEEALMAERKGLADDVRLACQARVMGSVTVQRLVLDDRDAEAAYLSTSQTGVGTGTAMKVAVLFSDIRGFTRFSERSLPYDVMHILNRYLYGVGEAIHRHHGYIDKYMGDGVMALFGLNGGGPEKAACDAVAAALDMITALDDFNVYLQEQFGETFQVGIGVHVGEVVVGEMGHPDRRQLTALGDVVNTASRVESATKEFAANLLVSEAVHGLVSGEVKSGRVVEATLKGKADTHKLFEVLDFAAPRTGADRGAHAARVVLQGITRMDAPGLLRLAFHDAISGGVDGSIRHPEALALPQNHGLEVPLTRLTQLKERLVDISWGDLIALAGAAAVERCGGPHIPLSLGRPEATVAFDPERVPGSEEAVGTLLERFAHLGLGARDLVALSGAHTLGKVDGSPFTSDPFSFSNSYFTRVLEGEDSLLQSDRTLLENPETRACVEEYARSERAFFVDFVAAYRRMCG